MTGLPNLRMKTRSFYCHIKVDARLPSRRMAPWDMNRKPDKSEESAPTDSQQDPSDDGSDSAQPKVLPDGRVADSQSHRSGGIALDEKSMALISAQSTPAELVAWGLKRFQALQKVMTTSFGMEGCALIDLCSKAIAENELPNLKVAWIDTAFFFPETHQLREKLEKRYSNIEIVRWSTSVSVQDQADTYGNELWKNNPNLCCHIRKVVPMKENIAGNDLWITGLRRTQSESRANTEILSWDWRYQLLKFCPLAAWTRADVWNYVQQNDVPFNQLHLQNYPSISCFHCTRSVPGSSPDSETRDGRWEGKDKDECGLHFSI